MTSTHPHKLRVVPTQRPPAWMARLGVVGLLTLLAPLRASALSREVCSPADTTWGCCIKRHPENPAFCGAVADCAPPPTAPSGAAVAVATVAAAGVGIATIILENGEQLTAEDFITQATDILKECAEKAQTDFIFEKLDGKIPAKSQCDEVLWKDSRGNDVTQAMVWGQEKHERALKCAEEALGKRFSGRFSLEQRYRYNRAAKHKQPMSRAEEELLIRQGRTKEFLGTLVPDVVLHTGNLLEVLAVFDFKFPCPISNGPKWRNYLDGHPYNGRTQGEMYSECFGVEPFRVAPRWGALR